MVFFDFLDIDTFVNEVLEETCHEDSFDDPFLELKIKSNLYSKLVSQGYTIRRLDTYFIDDDLYIKLIFLLNRENYQIVKKISMDFDNSLKIMRLI